MKLAISVRRSHRNLAPKDWIEQVRSLMPNSQVEGPMFGRIVVEMEDSTERELRSKLGEFLHIEPITRHKPTDNQSEPTQ